MHYETILLSHKFFGHAKMSCISRPNLPSVQAWMRRVLCGLMEWSHWCCHRNNGQDMITNSWIRWVAHAILSLPQTLDTIDQGFYLCFTNIWMVIPVSKRLTSHTWPVERGPWPREFKGQVAWNNWYKDWYVSGSVKYGWMKQPQTMLWTIHPLCPPHHLTLSRPCQDWGVMQTVFWRCSLVLSLLWSPHI